MHGSRAVDARPAGVTKNWTRFAARRLLPLAVFPLLLASPLPAADYARALDAFRSGDYATCLRETSEAIEGRAYGEKWPELKARVELRRGRYADARDTLQTALKRYQWSVRLRLLAHEAARHTGRPDEAAAHLEKIDELAQRAPWRYTSEAELLALGKAALRLGADAKDVMQSFFDRARKQFPDARDPWLASAELALAKHDDEFAADLLAEAAKSFPDDADVQCGLARAFRHGDRVRCATALRRALELNPRHPDALLLQAQRAIDRERYDAARDTLEEVLAVNSRHPRALAYLSVLSHLQNDPQGEVLFREAALSTWEENPEVDHLIGRVLSQKYRFAEGAEAQRRALAFDPQYHPARIQLAQDLLRLGEETRGWKTAETAHARDGYDVSTFNLLELKDRLDQFRTLENEHFVVRMDAREAEIYGDRVLGLLERARQTLCAKYDLELEEQVVVEIFPDANDFAVRTFGLPGVGGYLGVCFGRVITANSPASRADSPANWEAVLWHEFAHVVTLRLTRNRIPRWLSEGISVYEERQRNPAWGQRMNSRYREMVLGGELTPVGELSGAFLNPKSALHVQFAYYQSALVVEHMVQTYGLEALKLVLRDIRAGLPVNAALERRCAPLPKLEADFVEFASARAQKFTAEADWTRPDLPALLASDGDDIAQFVEAHPDNVAALSAYADWLIDDGRWAEAEPPLRRLIELVPFGTGGGNGYARLARVYRELGRAEDERRVLESHVRLDADAVASNLRLIELAEDAADWDAVLSAGERILAINPLVERVHRSMAVAAVKAGRPRTASAALRRQLAFDPSDPADVHFRLARLLHQQGDPAAKRHVLQALEAAPRYRAAHRLLLDIVRSERSVAENAASAADSDSRTPSRRGRQE